MTRKPSIRVNLNASLGITFAEVCRWLPLYANLGFKQLYTSCLLQNNPPGPDSDPRCDSGYAPVAAAIEPRLGGETGARLLCQEAARRGMAVALDLVHHMNRHGNPWWDNDVTRPEYFCCEEGPLADSPVVTDYAGFDHMVALNTSNPNVCASVYQPLLALQQGGLVNGFRRVDYADGLDDSHAFAVWLTARFGGPVLFEYTRPLGQPLPKGVVGTTGGDVIADLLRSCTNKVGLDKIAAAGVLWTGSSMTLQEHVDDVAIWALQQPWFRRHAERLHRLMRKLEGPDVTVDQIVDGLLYFTERMHPDYRQGPAAYTKPEQTRVEGSPLPHGVSMLLLLEYDKKYDEWVKLFWRVVANLRCLAFRIQRDLRFFPYHEGGCGADLEVVTAEQMNERVLDRMKHAPQTLVAAASHDTVWGPMERARAAAVTHEADLFLRHVEAWKAHLSHLRTDEVPGQEIEWLVYTVLAVLPVTRTADGTPVLFDVDAVFELVVRTAREHGRRTSWLGFNDKYEAALRQWLVAVYSHRPFTDALAEFHDTIDPLGKTFALSWVLLRLLPGTPHFEESELCGAPLLRDPHNRARVDLAPVEATLRRFEDGQAPTEETAHLWLVWRVLTEVQRHELDYEWVPSNDGMFAFRAGPYFVSVPLTTHARLTPPAGEGWTNLLLPLWDIINPMYRNLGWWFLQSSK